MFDLQLLVIFLQTSMIT